MAASPFAGAFDFDDAERFADLPSVLRVANGAWQARKRQWLGLGIKSEIGRRNNLLRMSKTVRHGTSVFDPVLWSSPTAGGALPEERSSTRSPAARSAASWPAFSAAATRGSTSAPSRSLPTERRRTPCRLAS